MTWGKNKFTRRQKQYPWRKQQYSSRQKINYPWHKIECPSNKDIMSAPSYNIFGGNCFPFSLQVDVNSLQSTGPWDVVKTPSMSTPDMEGEPVRVGLAATALKKVGAISFTCSNAPSNMFLHMRRRIWSFVLKVKVKGEPLSQRELHCISLQIEQYRGVHS
eukprot:1368973-Karenia_brevis.AAC.1